MTITNDDKNIIYNILTDDKRSVEEKYKDIVNIYPNYLNDKDIRKIIYEKIEGIFHDWLWTYFELLIFDEINKAYNLWYEPKDKEKVEIKLKNAILLYNKFFPSNDYNVNYAKEIENIKKWAKNALKIISKFIWNEKIEDLYHSAQDFRKGNARDIFVKLESWKEINFSLKIDKSWKIALSDWQTPDIFEKVYKRYFNLDFDKYQTLKNNLFWTTDENKIFEDFQNIALLTQKILIEQFNLKNAEVNNFQYAKITNRKNLIYFLKALKFYKNSKDNSIVILVDRLTWSIQWETILDEIDLENIDLKYFSFTPCKARKYKYCTEPWIKYKWKTFVSFQIKHKRWKNASNKFWDITIRLRTTWK